MSTKLVVIGDSLSQGFQSGSLSKADLAYPNILANALGVRNFQFPNFGDEGSWRINLEEMCRLLETEPANRPALMTSLKAIFQLRRSGKFRPEAPKISASTEAAPLFHNLSISGFELGDSDKLTDRICRTAIQKAKGRLLTRNQLRRLAMYATARRVLNPTHNPAFEDLTQLDKAALIAKQEGGIDYLLFWLGANNCLSSAVRMTIIWSEDADLFRYNHERNCTLWRPEHFRAILQRVLTKVEALNAKQVLVATIPHITVIPMCRGITPGASVDDELNSDGYHEFYTHFWINEREFGNNPRKHPYFSWQQARQIDLMIDEYNAALTEESKRRGWQVVNICRAFDQAAYRARNIEPSYIFPAPLLAALRAHDATAERFRPQGQPILDTRYPKIDHDQRDPRYRYEGGLISLDGMHPTTICNGLIAHEFLQLIKPNGNGGNRSTAIDWHQVIAADSLLVNAPPLLKSMSEVMNGLAKLAQLQGVITGAINLLSRKIPQ